MRKKIIGVRLNEELYNKLKEECKKEYGLTLSTLLHRIIECHYSESAFEVLITGEV